MSEFYLIFIWLGLATFIVARTKSMHREMVCGKEEIRFSLPIAFLIFLPIIIMAGLRGNYFDTPAYVNKFLKMPDTLAGLISYMSTVSDDKGFELFSGVLKVVFGGNEIIYLFIIALIQGVCIFTVFRKYSPDYLMSVFLFVASTDYISWMYNGIRQFLAVTIIFATTGLMLKKKYVPLIMVLLLAATIHMSALLMIPFVLVAQGKPWNRRTMSFIFATLIAVLLVDSFTGFLDTALADTQYNNVVGHWQAIEDEGTSFLRVAVYSVPALLSLLRRKKFERKNDPVLNLCINMSIISMGLYVLSMFTSGIYIGRLPIYCSLYGYILLPWEIKEIFEPRSARLVSICMVVAYLLFYYYQVHMAWGIA